MSVSLAQGVATVGRSVPILVSGFLAVLAFWLVYSNYGTLVAPSPAGMVLFESLPPVHTFLDLQFLASGRTVPFAQAAAFGVGLVVVRAILQSFWISLMLESYAGRRTMRSALRPAVHRALRAFRTMLGVEATFVVIALVSVFLASQVLGPGFGQIAVIGALMGGGFFLILAPVVAVAEAEGLATTLRLSIRGARVPGPRHSMLTFSYLAFTLLSSALTPGSAAAAATPSLLTWSYALFMSFLNLSVLAAYTYRWLVIRQPVVEAVEASVRR